MSQFESPSTFEVIAERVLTNSQPGNRKDPYKVGAVIEGGVMRTIISAGQAVGLQALGAHHAVDSFYGVSGGAYVAAHLQSEQTPQGTRMIIEDLTSREFIDFVRVFKGLPIVDVRYLTHNVLVNIKPLNWRSIVDASSELHIFAANALTGEGVDFNQFSCQEDVLEALYVTGKMPIVTGAPYNYETQLLMDGVASTGGIPLQEAIDDGCTHILSMLTKPQAKALKVRPVTDRIAAAVLRRQGYPILADKFIQIAQKYNETIELIERSNGYIKRPSGEDIRIDVLRAKDVISRVEKRVKVLERAAQNSYQDTLKTFRNFNLPLTPVP